MDVSAATVWSKLCLLVVIVDDEIWKLTSRAVTEPTNISDITCVSSGS